MGVEDIHAACTGCSRTQEPTQTQHGQVHLTDWVESACVDEALAPLIAYLWASGCVTRFSCQQSPPLGGGPDVAYIGFADGSSFDRAVQAIWQIARGDPRLEGRLQTLALRSPRQDGDWYHELHIRPGLERQELVAMQPMHFLKFPCEDLPLLEHPLLRHLQPG